jgi:large subunit ribosomal protein L4
MTINIVNHTNRKVGTMSLPKAIFGQLVKPSLLAQAIRVYQANLHQGSKKTKTRGEVNRTTAKIWRQKGTGRARHGSRKAPIFVGGGIVFGPNPISSPKKDLPKNMKRLALLGSLSQKVQTKDLIVLDSLAGFNGKTKSAQAIFTAIAGYQKGPKTNLLLVLPQVDPTCLRSCQNLAGLIVTQAKRLNFIDILTCQKLILVKEAIAVISAHYTAKSKLPLTVKS